MIHLPDGESEPGFYNSLESGPQASKKRAIALEENPSPSESDGSSRSQEACPQAIQKKQLIQEPLVPKKAKVKI